MFISNCYSFVHLLTWISCFILSRIFPKIAKLENPLKIIIRQSSHLSSNWFHFSSGGGFSNCCKNQAFDIKAFWTQGVTALLFDIFLCLVKTQISSSISTDGIMRPQICFPFIPSWWWFPRSAFPSLHFVSTPLNLRFQCLFSLLAFVYFVANLGCLLISFF